MSELADHILRGQMKEARALAEKDASSIRMPSTGPEQLFAADIALRCGRFEILAALLRLGAPMKLAPPPRASLLRDYLDYFSSFYFCASRMSGMAASVWEQVFEGRKDFFDGLDPAFGMADFEKEDIRWLLAECQIRTKDAFLAFEGDRA